MTLTERTSGFTATMRASSGVSAIAEPFEARVAVVLQTGFAQTPATQLALVQSASTRHGSPFGHWGQTPPPQSTPVSEPSFTAFEQVPAKPPVPPCPAPPPPTDAVVDVVEVVAPP